jgi:RES domain-containing protein
MAFSKPFEHHGTHRLIPTKYADADSSVLETLSLPAEVITDLSQLDAATNERKLAEQGENIAIGPGELLLGIPEAHIVNAAFCHPGPFGGRFNDSRRGAWYAGVELETSFAEVSFHRQRFLQDSRIADTLTFDYQEFLADFSGEYSQLDPKEMKTCLRPKPVPQCYAAGQVLANTLLHGGSNGIIYPSVRNPGGTCIACFRPALVYHPRRGKQYQLTVGAKEEWVAA